MHILHVVGARPNFMKAAPVHTALAVRGARQTVVHTGQHYDPALSGSFFSELGLPRADVNLGVGSGTHAEQTARVMLGLEPVLAAQAPDWVLVYGDVNSTLAAALVCAKSDLRTAHVEAGLRSRDRSMPEEHNRVVTDHLCDLLFTPSSDADKNLLEEGIPQARIRKVGNVMIDTLARLLPKARDVSSLSLSLNGGPFALVTLHRPSNVDDPRRLRAILGELEDISREVPVVFPMHPRTRKNLAGKAASKLRVTEPLPYLDFLSLQSKAALVITDSGGIQEETTYLGVPCLTLRPNTERPVTIELGTNELVELEDLGKKARKALSGAWKKGGVPPLWDGKAAERIAEILCDPKA